MRQGNTALKNRCEYMVRPPDDTYAPRTRKDPRDIRVLDPACGSGHFLLYAFDPEGSPRFFVGGEFVLRGDGCGVHEDAAIGYEGSAPWS
jgi:hypothetical protein